MTDSKKIKKAIKDYQGKYFKGNEMNQEDTYVHIKKIIENGDDGCTWFHTYADVIYKFDGKINFAQNIMWNFGEYHIIRYNYRRINGLLFNEILKNYKFRRNKHSTEYMKSTKPVKYKYGI